MFCAHFCNLVFRPPRVSVLVGAPKANTSQPGIVEAGAVYYCPWPGLPDSCRQIPFDNSSEYHRFTKDNYMVCFMKIRFGQRWDFQMAVLQDNSNCIYLRLIV